MQVYNRRLRAGQVSNKYHESDTKTVLQQTRWILTLIGIWPRVISNPTRYQKYIGGATLVFCLIAIASLLGAILCHAGFRATHREDALILFGPISYQTGILLKSLIFVSHCDGIKPLMEHVKADWRKLETSSDREIMIKYVKLGRDITTGCVIGLYGSSLLYCMVPYFMGPYTNELNESVRPMLFPGPDIFVDIQAGYNYQIVYLASLIGVCCCLFVDAAILNLALIFVTHVCGQIQIIMSRLKTLVDTTDNIVTIDNRIEFIIRNHVRVLRFSSSIEEFLRVICLVDVVAITLLLCWVEYWCLMDWQKNDIMATLQHVLLLISHSSHLLIFCHVGELLKEESQQIGKTSYMIEWYRLPGKTGLALILIMNMANYPCQLTAGRMLELSYYSFGSIMKTTVAYLNMMRTMAA